MTVVKTAIENSLCLEAILVRNHSSVIVNHYLVYCIDVVMFYAKWLFHVGTAPLPSILLRILLYM